jgi:ArsR family transcriptional regulator
MIIEKLQDKSELLKAIAHPVRLCIIRRLIEEPCNVSEMHTCLEKPQSTISQHLAKLKAARVIKGERNGTKICYKVIDEQVKKIVAILLPK